MKDVWGTIQLYLRLPEVPQHRAGGIPVSTGRTELNRRLGMPAIWAAEIQLVEMAARQLRKPRFTRRAG